jgi:hypothetical protein
MPSLLSGSKLRRGGSGDFIDLAGAQPQLPASETTETGFTIATDSVLRSSYRSSLGFIEFRTATMWSALPGGSIKMLATGTTFLSTGTASGTLVVTGGVGIGGNLYVKEDIVVNGLTIGQGYQGLNNIVIKGTASPQINAFDNGQESIVIGYDALKGLTTSYKSIAIGRYALNSGTNISNTIAIGDSALKLIGTNNNPILSTITNIRIISSSTISAATNAIPIVLTIASHGLSTGSQILISNAVGLSTATGAASVLNNTPFWVNWLSSNSVALYSNKSRTIPSNGFTATVGTSIYTLTAYVGSGTVITPVIVTSPNHGISTGTQISIDGIVGTTQLNQRSYFIDFITSSTLTLFSDIIIKTPINGTGYTAYSSSGTIFGYVTNDNNLALGIDTGAKLINGSNNFFLGNTLATNLVTGSNNTIIGHSVGNNITQANGIIAFGGDNLVDGVDNQVNIGSVFYYDGRGNTDINSDTRTGLGTESTSTNSGALVVVGGLGIAGKVYSGGGGNPDEGYELYTPIVTVTTGTAPTSPKIGDIWIDASTPAYLQYIKDGTSTFWIQVGAV